MKSLLPLALLAAAPMSAAMAEPPATAPIAGTRLDVTATGTVRRVPDVATVGAGVVTQAHDAGAAMKDNAARTAATIAALRRAGVAERDIQTASISLQPQYRYGDNVPPVLTSYQASNRVNVRLRDVSRAGSVLDALVAAGANQIDGPTLTVDKADAALDEARTQATATARARADLYAKATGLRVVRIVAISEGSNDGPVVRPMMAMSMAKREAADTPVAAGEQDLAVTVAVTFELG